MTFGCVLSMETLPHKGFVKFLGIDKTYVSWRVCVYVSLGSRSSSGSNGRGFLPGCVVTPEDETLGFDAALAALGITYLFLKIPFT